MKKLMTAVTLGVAALAMVVMAAPAQKKMVQIKGSDTMVNLVQILAEEYMAKNPRAALAVLGGGSGTGITAIINQTCDIANHSREWKQKEIDQAWEKGVQPRFFVIAVDGLSMIVHEKQSVGKTDHGGAGRDLPRRDQELEDGRRPGQARLALRTAVQLRHLRLHAGARAGQ